MRTPQQVRADTARLVDRAEATRRTPKPLLERWRRAVAADELWRFESAVVLGGAGAASFLFDDVDGVPQVTGLLEWHGLSVGDPATDLQWLASAPAAADDVYAAYVAHSGRAPDARARERARLYAELEFAKWLVHGHETGRADIIDDAVGLLESLAAGVAGDDIVTDAALDVDDAIALLERMPDAAPAAVDTSMQTDAYDPEELSLWVTTERTPRTPTTTRDAGRRPPTRPTLADDAADAPRCGRRPGRRHARRRPIDITALIAATRRRTTPTRIAERRRTSRPQADAGARLRGGAAPLARRSERRAARTRSGAQHQVVRDVVQRDVDLVERARRAARGRPGGTARAAASARSSPPRRAAPRRSSSRRSRCDRRGRRGGRPRRACRSRRAAGRRGPTTVKSISVSTSSGRRSAHSERRKFARSTSSAAASSAEASVPGASSSTSHSASSSEPPMPMLPGPLLDPRVEERAEPRLAERPLGQRPREPGDRAGVVGDELLVARRGDARRRGLRRRRRCRAARSARRSATSGSGSGSGAARAASTAAAARSTARAPRAERVDRPLQHAPLAEIRVLARIVERAARRRARRPSRRRRRCARAACCVPDQLEPVSSRWSRARVTAT